MIRSIYAPILFSLGFGFIGAFIVLFTPANASAASAYDSSYQLVNDMTIGTWSSDDRWRWIVEDMNDRYIEALTPVVDVNHEMFGCGREFTDIASKNITPYAGVCGSLYHDTSRTTGQADMCSANVEDYGTGHRCSSLRGILDSFLSVETRTNWIISQECPDNNEGGYGCSIKIVWSEDDNMVLNWQTNGIRYGVNSGSCGDLEMLTIRGAGSGSGQRLAYQVDFNFNTCANTNTYMSTASGSVRNFIAVVNDENYPAGYDGINIRDTEPGAEETDEVLLTPEYTWSINGETGELKVVYMKNISPFLTGTSYTVLEGMQAEFESPLTPIDSQSHQPAGWLDYSYTLQPGEGWYSLRIDHNQQLDKPPWEYDSHDKPRVLQQYFQIYWDGKSSISGNNIGGCEGQICNNLRDTGSNKLTRFMNQLSFNTFGLESIIILPINYLAQVPSLVDSCQPIHVPFVAGSDFNIPCLRSTYMNAIPVLMGTVFVLINGLVMYLVAINTLRLVKNTADPDHDRIETTDL